jgi:alkylation response protein AidB-like acyl-CoA dehydrogenase
MQTFIEIARKKSLPFTLNSKMADEARIQSLVGQAITRLGAARAFFLQSLTDVWQTLRDSLPEHSDAAPFHSDTAYSRLSIDQRIRIRLAMVEVHDACVDLVNRIYKAAGSTALYSTCILDRLLRDIHTISQHVIVSTKVHEIAGKMTFGSPPDEPFF